MAKKTNQPAPVLATEGVTGTENNAAEVVTLADIAPQGGTKANVFTNAAAEVSKAVAAKVQLLSSARQRLAEASDYYNSGDSFTREATAVADKAAALLYQGRTNGTLSAEEVSAALGDVFGFKMKADGKPGKTPDKQGEHIRKRVVRAVNAMEYVTNGDGGRFFEGLPENEIAGILNGLEGGAVSIWSAYDMFADVKKAHAIKTEAAFNPAAIAKIVEALTGETAGEIVRASPALVAAYGALIEVLAVIGTEEAPVSAEG